MSPIDRSLLCRVSDIQDEDPEETIAFREQHDEARDFLLDFDWCSAIVEEYFCGGVGGIVSISFFKILPGRPEVDSYLWVVVGDIPPAYLVIDDLPTPADALECYIELMDDWCEAVMSGESVKDLVPVNVRPTKKWARELESRLRFIEQRVLPKMAGYKGD